MKNEICQKGFSMLLTFVSFFPCEISMPPMDFQQKALLSWFWEGKKFHSEYSYILSSLWIPWCAEKLVVGEKKLIHMRYNHFFLCYSLMCSEVWLLAKGFATVNVHKAFLQVFFFMRLDLCRKSFPRSVNSYCLPLIQLHQCPLRCDICQKSVPEPHIRKVITSTSG